MLRIILQRPDRAMPLPSGCFPAAWLTEVFYTVFLLCICNHCDAGIASFEGAIQLIEPPAHATWSKLEDDEFAKLFAERQSVLLSEELYVDVSIAGVVDESKDLTPAGIINETVNSYLLHSDPLLKGHPPRDYQGSITFFEEIVGIMVTVKSLNLSDGLLGAIDTIYVPRNIYSGFEGPGFPTQGKEINDRLELRPDLRTVSFHFMTTSMLDQIRIVTRADDVALGYRVPEPAYCSTSLVVSLIFYRKLRTTCCGA